MDEYDVMNRRGIQLHGIIVTHPDSDHLNGITKLLEKHRHRIFNNYDVLHSIGDLETTCAQSS